MSGVATSVTNLTVGQVPVLALAANAERRYLYVENLQGGRTLQVKLGSNFTAAQSAEQNLVFAKAPTSGTIKFSFGGNETAALDPNNNAAMQAALEGLAGIGSGNILVSGNPTDGINIKFQGALNRTQQSAISVSANTTKDATRLNNKQLIKVSGAAPNAGTFSISFRGENTPAFGFDATADDLNGALQALSLIGSGNVSVTGTDIHSGFTVEFVGALGLEEQPLIEVDTNTLEVTDTATPSQYLICSSAEPTAGTYKVAVGQFVTDELPFDTVAADLEVAIRALDESLAAVDVSDAGSGLLDGMVMTLTGVPRGGADELVQVLEASTLKVDGAELFATALKIVPGVTGVTLTDINITETQVGSAGAACAATMTVLFPGWDGSLEGLSVKPSEFKEWQSAVPIDAIYVVADGAGCKIEVREG